ncbi:hypothetical protein HMPREF9129_1120 [Peptoniphilus indolicus ATCC 29427]|uniref:Uncharacterized protein n=1 Tax=Peptoniphilus indolicus ATCC 29427 TaxID=997350 RepID=G4D3Z0_9FIRM|nr:hypothetical protein HMPREF9129_1120 [Peptoniphilus indolicus ATCC 29427]
MFLDFSVAFFTSFTNLFLSLYIAVDLPFRLLKIFEISIISAPLNHLYNYYPINYNLITFYTNFKL